MPPKKAGPKKAVAKQTTKPKKTVAKAKTVAKPKSKAVAKAKGKAPVAKANAKAPVAKAKGKAQTPISKPVAPSKPSKKIFYKLRKEEGWCKWGDSGVNHESCAKIFETKQKAIDYLPKLIECYEYFFPEDENEQGEGECSCCELYNEKFDGGKLVSVMDMEGNSQTVHLLKYEEVNGVVKLLKGTERKGGAKGKGEFDSEEDGEMFTDSEGGECDYAAL